MLRRLLRVGAEKAARRRRRQQRRWRGSRSGQPVGAGHRGLEEEGVAASRHAARRFQGKLRGGWAHNLLNVAASLHGHTSDCSSALQMIKRFSTNIHSHSSAGHEHGVKEHAMLSPFTAGWQSTNSHPLVIESSEGCFVYDDKGNRYLDGLAGLFSTALGGGEPRLVKAACNQLNKLPFYHSFWNRTTRPSLDLAEELIGMFTAKEMEKVFFTTSGSEANDTQGYDNHIHTATKEGEYENVLCKPTFLHKESRYHGTTFISASLSGLPVMHQDFDLPRHFVLHTDCPHFWRFHAPGETEEEFATRLANNLENLIIREGPETIAAFIAEPVIGAGGVIPPPKTYFEKIQTMLKKYEILFIADEVITGFGRLGTMFGCDLYNIKPDLVSLAKALSSAYAPIGALLVSPEISDVVHSHSDKVGKEIFLVMSNIFQKSFRME